MSEQKFTVILLRPDYLASDDVGGYGHDVYIAHVNANSARRAGALGQSEVFGVDIADELEPNDADDYAVLAVFPGHIQPVVWGWQL